MKKLSILLILLLAVLASISPVQAQTNRCRVQIIDESYNVRISGHCSDIEIVNAVIDSIDYPNDPPQCHTYLIDYVDSELNSFGNLGSCSKVANGGYHPLAIFVYQVVESALEVQLVRSTQIFTQPNFGPIGSELAKGTQVRIIGQVYTARGETAWYESTEGWIPGYALDASQLVGLPITAVTATTLDTVALTFEQPSEILPTRLMIPGKSDILVRDFVSLNDGETQRVLVEWSQKQLWINLAVIDHFWGLSQKANIAHIFPPE